VGPRDGLDSVEDRKICWAFRELNPGRPALRPPLYRLNYRDSFINNLTLFLRIAGCLDYVHHPVF
jgi:hypothetical protein